MRIIGCAIGREGVLKPICSEIKEQLYCMSDPAYRAFQSGLLPTVPVERIIGVRVPALRRLARTMARDGRDIQYLTQALLPHETYDEDLLHAFLIEGLADYDTCMKELQRFLPYVDNWAVCDLMTPLSPITRPDALFTQILVWLLSDHEYTVRFGLVMLMRHFLGERFMPQVLAAAAGVSHDGYYVRMAVAWLFAEALACRWWDAYPYLADRRLPVWTHRRAIQKALESRKLSPEQKSVLRRLREEDKK